MADEFAAIPIPGSSSVRVVKLQRSGSDPDMTTDERIMLWQHNELTRLRQFEADYRNTLKFVADEECSASEKHCGCVAPLKMAIARLQADVERLTRELRLKTLDAIPNDGTDAGR